MLGRKLDLHLGEPDPVPEWIVDDLVERGTVILLAADSGAGKSFLCMHMGACIARQEPWLGKATHGERVLWIDNENHPRIVRKRLRMLGLDDEHDERLAYFNRLGVQLGAGQWLDRTLDEVEAFQPDVIVIDTVSSCTKAVSPPDGGGSMGGGNEAISYLYATVLRPLAATSRSVILLHHTKKPADGVKVDPRYAALGGGQWRGQADSMFYLERKGEVFDGDDGVKRFPVAFSLIKDRDGNTMHLPLAFSSQMKGDRLHGWLERWPKERPADDGRYGH